MRGFIRTPWLNAHHEESDSSHLKESGCISSLPGLIVRHTITDHYCNVILFQSVPVFQVEDLSEHDLRGPKLAKLLSKQWNIINSCLQRGYILVSTENITMHEIISKMMLSECYVTRCTGCDYTSEEHML